MSSQLKPTTTGTTARLAGSTARLAGGTSRLTGSAARLAGATAAAAGTGVVAGAAGLWLLAPEPVRANGLGGLGAAATVVAGGSLVAAGGWLTTGWWVRRHLGGARRLVSEVDLIATVNPNHRVSATGSEEVAAVAAAVNRLADRFWESLSERDAAIARGRAEAERDRERLAALMADLSHGVLVCDTGGRIVLYNAEARQMLSVPGSRSPVGLGLSVYDALDKGVLASALHRFELDPGLARPVRFTAIGPAGLLFRASVGPVRAVTDPSRGSGRSATSEVYEVSDEPAGGGGSGFVVVLEDAANEIEARNLRADLVREMLEESRGRLAAIGGAVAMLEDFADFDHGQVARFRSIISEETARLTGYLADVQERHQQVTGIGWERTDIACRDLMRAAQHRIGEATGLEVTVGPDDGLWARVDAAGLIEALTRAASEMTASGQIRYPTMRCWSYPPFVALGLSWLAEPTTTGAGTDPDRHQVPSEIASLTRTHGGEAWLHRSDTAELTVLLPTGGVGSGGGDLNTESLGAWPTTYDFSLPAHQSSGPPSVDRLLAELPYTAIAVTTTPYPEPGPAPSAAVDARIITAVRIVNGRLLPHETFQATTGVADEPIPGFADFAGQTILVNHGPEPALLGPLPHPQLNTMTLANLALGPTTGRSLEALAATLGLAPDDQPSTADAVLGSAAALTAEVFLRLLPLLEIRGLRTLGDVTSATATAQVGSRSVQDLVDGVGGEEPDGPGL